MQFVFSSFLFLWLIPSSLPFWSGKMPEVMCIHALRFVEAFVPWNVVNPRECSTCSGKECGLWVFFRCNVLEIPIRSWPVLSVSFTSPLLYCCEWDAGVPAVPGFLPVSVCSVYGCPRVLGARMLASKIFFLYHRMVSFFIFLYVLCYKVCFV